MDFGSTWLRVYRYLMFRKCIHCRWSNCIRIHDQLGLCVYVFIKFCAVWWCQWRKVPLKNWRSSVIPTVIDQRSQNLRHFYPGMGINLGSSGFCHNQNNHGLSGVFMPLHLLQSEREDKTCITHSIMCEDRGGIGFASVFCVRGWQKTGDPQTELYGWWRHYTGRCMRSWISCA